MVDIGGLLGRNIVVFDLEIKTPIEKCKNGWRGYDEMGISVGCLYDYRDNLFRVFMDDNISELVERLNEEGTLVVAFNHTGFDNKLLRGCGLPLRSDEELKNYDMLSISKMGAGLHPNAKISGFKLDQHLEALGLPRKTADGSEAPLMWQEKRLGTLVSYCLNDVYVEKTLFEYFFTHGKSACYYQKEPYEIQPPCFT